MKEPEARFDAIADWYAAWAGDGNGLIAEYGADLVPPSLAGRRVLDVACGAGRAARSVARLGAAVVGVDLSVELIALAQARESDERLGITYQVADVADLGLWWDGVPFDGAVCEMALMDIDDLGGVAGAVAAALTPDGWFVLSLVHPCFPGSQAGLSSWPPERSYFDEGRWTSTDHNPDGVRVRVGSTHRMLSTYLNTLVEVGFALERIVEPSAPVPTFILLKCRRS